MRRESGWNSLPWRTGRKEWQENSGEPTANTRRDKKWLTTFLFSFPTCVQKQQNLIKLRVLKNCYLLKNWVWTKQNTYFTLKHLSPHMKTPEQFDCPAVIQANTQFRGCCRTTSLADRSSLWTSQHRDKYFFLTSLHFFHVQEWYFSQFTCFCMLFWKALYQRLDILSPLL